VPAGTPARFQPIIAEALIQVAAFAGIPAANAAVRVARATLKETER
jgi:alkylhydroperoxidase/carboxymuconolactone decarboxylase family protein YurZ